MHQINTQDSITINISNKSVQNSPDTSIKPKLGEKVSMLERKTTMAHFPELNEFSDNMLKYEMARMLNN